ncbi:phosphate transport system permease protein [Rhodobium orientis]|uniref:Phosphate transport system permease protein PstA n=1 Tax=Rhodobium orientis TaxID=34017 RepID=A0A327JLW6_9HYPH|nr:phosphate ABC transporter permease PstA [Rhodobium orientis]MBB4304922.1 phosphate transport system permease protein [Rhodobium orientis]MBK5951241.1 phosphate ABC transporter, permease protein PstA [Rhodobium orientis]RAI27081.1 phosphate ABC transporter, permease protein PstA [Rhodobium orientis]
MTDATLGSPLAGPARKKSSLLAVDALTKKRNASEARFKAYGVSAVVIGLLFLVALLWAILSNGLGAFSQTFIQVPVKLDKGAIEAAEKSIVKTSKYRAIINTGFRAELGRAGIDTGMDDRGLQKMMSSGAAATLREFVLANPDQIGRTVTFEFVASSRVDGYLKGRVKREDLINDKNLDAAHLDLIDAMRKADIVTKTFNWQFVLGTDASDSRPEQAGMGASMVGSFFMMLVVLMLSLPIGVAASIYLEEFAPQNWLTDLIEVNISNLAAVPSIVFGILGLAVFIQFAHLPQSAPLVGGLVLTLMTLPTIIISTRASLKAVPPSIRDAALGVGASKMQSIFHHVLPLAMPGILTGTIIGLAQALGETAPLLLIGMVGFIASNFPEGVGDGFLAPNSAMPAQIYEWAKRADPAFYERAWGGIIILLVFLMAMNILAIVLRRRFERRW